MLSTAHTHIAQSAWDCLNYWDNSFPNTGKHLILPSLVELFFCDFANRKSLQIEYRYTQAPVVFAFWLEGVGRGHFSFSPHEKAFVELKPGKAAIHYIPGVLGKTEMLEKQHYRNFSLYVSPAWLLRLLEDEEFLNTRELCSILGDKAHRPYYQVSDMSARVRMILEQIYHCPYRGAHGKMYLENKCLELIICQLEDTLVSAAERKQIRLVPRDIERIHEAKQIISHNLENPPTLQELSRMVGINRSKLSYGFRQVFGSTAHALLQKERLQLAGVLLSENRMNITEISQYLGFSDASHFVREFSKQYGTTPGKFAKTITTLQ